MTIDSSDALELSAQPLRYFSHDADASADPKCKRLIRCEGVAGYGRWWLLCELLAGERGHTLSLSTEDDWDNLACALELDMAEDAREFVDVLVRIGLVCVDGAEVYSPRMLRTAEYFGRQRAKGKAGGRARAKAMGQNIAC